MSEETKDIHVGDTRMIQQIICNASDIANLKEWQKVQNGSIQRIESKVDKMLWAMYITMFGIILNLFKDKLIQFFVVKYDDFKFCIEKLINIIF